MPEKTASVEKNVHDFKPWKEKGPWTMPKWEVEEDIVISGISGRFPEALNVEELKENLYNGLDMISENDRRWHPGLLGTPRRTGKLKDINSFDSKFFGVNDEMADAMDPQQRILLEVTYEAIFDAGIDPNSLRGKNIGVFLGCSEICAMENKRMDWDCKTGYDLLVLNLGMVVQRISVEFGFTGPCLCLDTACSSTFHALNQAVMALRNNRCEAAIVAGSTISVNLLAAYTFSKIGLTSADGKCRVFDDRANGYVRSEGVGAVLLQRVSEAKRIYLTIMHIKLNNDGSKPEGITFPGAQIQKQLYKEVYSELDLDPSCVTYLEAHGTGTVAGDREESNAIAEFFLVGRDTPLPIGSVKSNLGHAEAASGMESLAKIILSMEEELIPPNIHYEQPNQQVTALVEGNLKVVKEVTPWKPGLVAVNNFGFGGSNCHAVVNCNTKEYTGSSKREIPRLVLACGRSKTAVEHILQQTKEKKVSNDAIALLEDACTAPTTRMRYRGFTFLDDTGSRAYEVVEKSPTDIPQIWFLFSGRSSLWNGNVQDMMKIHIFAESVNACGRVLEPYGVDIVHLLTDETSGSDHDEMAKHLCVLIIQIALVDVMKALQIEPNGVASDTVGELIGAYATGSASREHTMKVAYWIGKRLQHADTQDKELAVIGLSWSEAVVRCPSNVTLLCKNGETAVTVAGSQNEVQSLVAESRIEEIFAEHSMQYKMDVARKIQKKGTDALEEAIRKIPNNAFVVNFNSTITLDHAIEKVLGMESRCCCLINGSCKNNVSYFLKSIGKLYILGFNPVAKNLYDKVEYPVPRGTAMLSSLIQWNHDRSWHIKNVEWSFTQNRASTIDARRDDHYKYLLQHTIDGQVIFPTMGFVFVAWKACVERLYLDWRETPVIIHDIRFKKSVVLPASGIFNFQVHFLEGTFNIIENGQEVVSGMIEIVDEEDVRKFEDNDLEAQTQCKNAFTMNGEDFYKEMRLRGYEYGPAFQTVQETLDSGLQGYLSWDGHWVPFMEAFLQLSNFSNPETKLPSVTSITSVRIDPTLFPSDNEVIPFKMNPRINGIKAGGMEVQGTKWDVIPKTTKRNFSTTEHILEECVFLPFIADTIVEDEELLALRNYTHACSSAASRIIKKANIKVQRFPLLPIVDEKDDSGSLTEQFVKGENNGLLGCLLEIEKCLLEPKIKLGFLETKERVLPIIREFAQSVQDDLLINVGIQKNINDLLSIASDNVSSKDFVVSEVKYNAEHQGDVLVVNTRNIANENTEKRSVKAWLENVNLTTLCSKTEQSCSLDQIPQNNVLLVARNVLTDSGFPVKNVMKSLANAVTPKGFILITERTSLYPAEMFLATLSGKEKHKQSEKLIEETIRNAGLCIIAKTSNQLSNVAYLLRKIPTERDKKITNQIFHIPEEPNDFDWVGDLKSKMGVCSREPERIRLWLHASNPASGIFGLFNSLRCEPGGEILRMICNSSLQEGFEHLTSNAKVMQDIFRKDLATNVYRDGQWGIFTYRPISNTPTPKPRDNVFLSIKLSGDETQFEWTESKPEVISPLPSAKETNAVSVYYAPIMKLYSDARTDEAFGMEFSGVDDRGRRVMGVASSQAMASHIVVPSSQLLEVPSLWTLEEASSVPIVYLTAYYALMVKGNLKPEQTVLIHCDSTGLGYAATAIALSMNCEVFANVDTVEQMKMMEFAFPEMDDRHISLSRSDSYETQVLNATRGTGVNLILNTLENTGFTVSARCLKVHGHFVDLRHDNWSHESIGMGMLQKNCTIHGAIFSSLLQNEENDLNDLKTCMNLLKEGIQNRTVRPIPYKLFPWKNAREAFVYMESGLHVGKVILKMRVEEATPTQFSCVPRTYFHPTKSYIVLGDLRGIGFEAVKWLIEKGARNVVLSSDRTKKTGYEKLWFQRWADQGARVTLSKHSASSTEGATSLIDEAAEMGLVHGVFHVDMVFQNERLMAMSAKRFQAIWSTTAQSVRNLDQASRKRCSDLQYFVLFSSLGSVTGMQGRSCYGFCCSAMERVVEGRRNEGLPGIAIQFGAIGDTGPDFENIGKNEATLKDCASQKIASCLTVLDRFLQEDYTVVSSYVPLVRKHCSSTESENNEGTRRNQENLQPKHQPKSQRFHIIRQPEVAEEVLIPLNSKAKDYKMSKCLFFVHPLEGHTGMLKEVANLLKLPAYGLQFTSHVPHSSIQDIAKYYVKQIKSIQPNGPYHLCGLSFGSLIAFEIALHLGKTDQIKTFICIDGSPKTVIKSSKLWHGDQDGEQGVMLAPYTMLVQTHSNGMTEEMEEYLVHHIVKPSMKNALKVDKFATLLGLKAPQETIEELLTLNKKIAAAMSCYEPSGKLQGKAIRVNFHHTHWEQHGNSYPTRCEDDLNKYVSGPIEIITLNCSKLQALEEKASSLAAIIDSRIDN